MRSATEINFVGLGKVGHDTMGGKKVGSMKAKHSINSHPSTNATCVGSYRSLNGRS